MSTNNKRNSSDGLEADFRITIELARQPGGMVTGPAAKV
jgi:hypothetical protein